MITFYDIPSTLPSISFSPNTYKTRLSLNFKRLPYNTEWVEFPDIEALCKQHNIAPTPAPFSAAGGRRSRRESVKEYYSLPAIVDGSKALAESFEIAKYLDEAYPDTPRLIPQGSETRQREFITRFGGLIYPPIGPIFLQQALSILNPASKPYFSSTRGRIFGKASLEEISIDRGEESRMWEEFRSAWNTLYDEFFVRDDPWFEGKEMSFADLVVVGYLWCFCGLFGEDSWQWLDLRNWNGGNWGRMYDETAHLRAQTLPQQAHL